MAVAIAPCTVASFHLGHGLGMGNKTIKGDYVAGTGVLRVLKGRGVGNDAHNLLLELLLGQKDIDDVAVGLRHFLAVGARNNHNPSFNAGFGQHKNFLTHSLMNGFGDVARNFKMLLLVLAHGHDMGVVEQNVCSHKYRIIKKPRIDVAEPVGLVFKAVGIGQHRVGREAVEVPSQLGALGQVALGIKHGALRIQSAGQPGGCRGQKVCLARLGVFDGGQRMQVRNKQKGLVRRVFSQFNSRKDCAQHVPEVLASAALNSGEDACHGAKVVP